MVMGGVAWSAAQYVAFEAERTRPVRDLLAAVPTAAARAVVDLGCGPGNSTELLAARFPDALVSALDGSAEMAAAARARLPGVAVEVGRIEDWAAPGPFDVILANASLHWVADHAALLPRLAGRLAAGGSLAAQMPDNLGEPAHALMRAVAAEGPWAGRMEEALAARTALLDARGYYATLRPACRAVEIWRTTYYHPLAGGADAVVAWFEGSGLRPFLRALDGAERAAFLARYREEIALAYPVDVDGSVLLPFPRLFFVATR